MSMTSKELRQRVEQLKGSRSQIKKDIRNTKTGIKKCKRKLKKHKRAREILREVGIKTQEQLQYHISNITSLALKAVFDDPYELDIDFVKKRNNTECELHFVRNDHKIEPLEGAGVGAVDVASFSLRIASWSMQRPHPRPVIILDEPFKHLSTDLQPRASEMIKEISEKLNLQLIIITHEEELEQEADNIIKIANKNGKSYIKGENNV